MVPDLALHLGHAPLQLDQLHVQSGLLAFERSDLLLETAVFVLLVGVVALHFLFNFEVFVGQSLAHLLGLQSDHVFESVLFFAEHNHLTLVHGELVRQRTN